MIADLDTEILHNALRAALVAAYIANAGQKTLPGTDADFLEAFRVLVKGDSTWNAIRENCRELVYYRNCINMGRRDALPKVLGKMAVRTACLPLHQVMLCP